VYIYSELIRYLYWFGALMRTWNFDCSPRDYNGCRLLYWINLHL